MEREAFEEDSEEVSLSDIFHVLWLRKKLLVSATVLLTLVAVLVIFQLVPRYTAKAQLLIGINSAKVVDIEEVMTGGLSGDSAVIGEMEVIKSRKIAHNVIEKLHLDQLKEFNFALKKKDGFFSQFSYKDILPSDFLEMFGLSVIDNRDEEEQQQALKTEIADNFLDKLNVSQVKRSQILNLTYESEDPKLAAKIANEVAKQYIVGQLQAKFDATKTATDWLNDQLSELKETVKLSEQVVEVFRQSHGLINVGKEQGLSQRQLSEINSQLIIARAERAEAQAKYNQVARILKSGRDIDSVSAVLNSNLIQRLREQEAEVQRTYSEMLVEFGKKHPRMIAMGAKVNDIKRKIRSEVKKIAAGLRNSLAVYRSRENSLAHSLKQIKRKTGGNNKDEVQLRALEREADANRTLFETFLTRFKETTSTQGLEQADARVISDAEPPLSASFPKKKLLLIVSFIGSLFFAIVLVFVLEMLNPGIRSPEQVQDLLKVATLGIIPISTDSKVSPHQYLLDKPQSSLAEAVNTLRVSLSVLNPDSQVKTMLVTSSVPSEGKSTLTLMIARQSAKVGQRVVIVDADLRRPTIEKQMGLKDTLGLTDLLGQKELSLDDVLTEDPKTGMQILARGKASFVNPTDLFASRRMQVIVNELKERFDLVIFDSPPIMAVPDARVLSGLIDKVIFVVAWDKTPRKVIHSALHQLQREGHNNLAGVVLQQVNLQQYGRYGDSGYYYHYSQYGQYYTS